MGNREHDVASILVAREPPIYIQSHVFLSRIALPRDRQSSAVEVVGSEGRQQLFRHLSRPIKMIYGLFQ